MMVLVLMLPSWSCCCWGGLELTGAPELLANAVDGGEASPVVAPLLLKCYLAARARRACGIPSIMIPLGEKVICDHKFASCHERGEFRGFGPKEQGQGPGGGGPVRFRGLVA